MATPHRVLTNSLAELEKVIDANLAAARSHRDDAIAQLDAIADGRVQELMRRVEMAGEDLQRLAPEQPDLNLPF